MFKWVGLHKPGGQSVAYENCISNCQQKIQNGSIGYTILINVRFVYKTF